ncbi:MAG: hypothetical protein KJN72_07115 [Woeseia sp.]|nr:hypothetical protein [Woeseia sp.]
MFNWLKPNKGKGTSVIGDLAIRATIAYKLRKYNADEDTTISEFFLAGEAKKPNATGKQMRVRENDAWSQANPRETGKWKKENR